MALLLFVVFLAVIGVAAATGRAADTRDPEFSPGRLLGPRGETAQQDR